ncbi:DUF6455 family protein [Roseovarius sp. 2305UL8-3]|uniref:DUF6455 family protein n=1 Tax=Roseovarius conchicola TaxID=3121636 RepID=UPI003529442F
MRRSILRIPASYRGLMENMTRAMGLKVIDDAETLNLSPEDVERLMHRCTQCCGQTEYAGLIAKAQGKMAEPPQFCPNRKAVSFLKQKSDQIER